MNKSRFETFLAISDLLVLTACQRAHVRQRRGRGRAEYVGPRDLHRAYEKLPVPPERIDAAMESAWVLCAMLNARHQFDVDPTEWGNALDGYTRALLMMGQPHTMSRLRDALTQALAMPQAALRAVP